MTQPRKKLIEVALPLEAINRESIQENYIYKGNPSAVHKWWAQRPLAACRAVLFASLVDDPASCPEEFPTEAAQDAERQRLFDIIEDLVKWENSNNEAVLHRARTEIARSVARAQGVSLPHRMTPDEVADALRKYAPPVLDPFAGGGSIPLEAQRLGLEAHASDLNPVAVLINKALIEIPPKFANRSPVNPEASKTLLQREWRGAQGLAEDVRYYGKWMRDEAWKHIGHLYPKVTLSKELGGDEATVIAWLWARTVKCPNPACGTQMPLVRSFAISTKKSKEAWVEPIIDQQSGRIQFEVRRGKSNLDGTVSRQGVRCLVCGSPASLDHVRIEGQAGRMNVQLMAIVAEGKGGRTYLTPSRYHEEVALQAKPEWAPEMELSRHPQYMGAPRYGMRRHRDLFTNRQLVALDSFTKLVQEARQKVLEDAISAGMLDNRIPLNKGGSGATAYADALATYLAFACDKYAMYGCALAAWYTKEDRPSTVFGRQTIAMVWDYTEINPFAEIGGSFTKSTPIIADAIESLANERQGYATQKDATSISIDERVIVSTDPPYYDNVPYADLSDFFYVWLRHSLHEVYPELFSTLLVPKNEELVADQHRYGSKSKADEHFVKGIRQVFVQMRHGGQHDYPLTVYYAFKQSETNEDESHGTDNSLIASTGWETMLEGLIDANYSITGTWPMHTERGNRVRGLGSNALASSIILVCRPRPIGAPLTSRGEFLRALKRELPAALKDLQRGNIAPVDLAQAAIGPGMAVFSRYSKVLEADGSAMRVRTALQLINQALDEVLAEQEGEYDADTRWAVAWFEQYGLEDGPYGVAETLSKAKNTAVERLVEAGILSAKGGKVRLLRRDELSEQWTPAQQARLTVWEVTQRLIRALDKEGEQGAAAVLDHASAQGEIARDLAYRLYTTCERKGWAQEALAYNSLVVEWRGIAGQAERLPAAVQSSFGEDF